MPRIPVLVLVLLLLAPPLVAEEARTPKPIELKGVPALVTPPGLPGEARTTAPGQWQVTYTGKGTFFRMQVRVFPVRDNREPGPVLMQALDTLVRNNNFGAFGATGRKTYELWGRPVAEAAINVSMDGKVARGHARLLLATNTHWAFAWGLVTAPELTRGTLAQIRAFTTSLEPRDPTFHTPRFRRDDELRRIVFQARGEPPVSAAHLRAVASLLEAGLDRRMSLASRKNLEDMLLLDVRKGTPKSRTGYRASAEDVARSMQLDAKARGERMRALGKRILDAIETRAKEGYMPAVGARRIWTQDKETLAGQGAGALEQGVLACEAEVALFLLAVAHDGPVKGLGNDALVRHTAERRTGWMERSVEERAAIQAVRRDWPRLRFMWDNAKPAARTAFRRAVIQALLPADVDAALPPADDLRGLKRWLEANRARFADAAALRRALALTPEKRAALALHLGVDVKGFQLGW